MKNRKTIIKSLPALIICLLTTGLLFVGCAEDKASLNCPFTELSWEATLKDMTDIEGELYETYPSIYQGTTYTYQKDYLNNNGIIKYMYDDKDKLCNVSWSYAGENADSVAAVYRAVCDDTEKIFGSGKDDDGVGNYCRVWVTDCGTVMANAVMTNDTNVFQIAYMSPEVSKLSGAE
ncbi:MAG: hypothetical protein K6G22_02285 [Lachnospiraceae bacterium]|nr:hypothetical protein [Lachnospiraceae bacterium]